MEIFDGKGSSLNWETPSSGANAILVGQKGKILMQSFEIQSNEFIFKNKRINVMKAYALRDIQTILDGGKK